MALVNRAKSLAKRALGRLRPAAPPVAPPVPRADPLPPMAAFPQGRFVFLVEAVPRNFGGRTASILNKARLFKELAGVDTELVIQTWSGELFDAVEGWRARGLLPDGLTVTTLDDQLPDPTSYAGADIEHPIEIPGLAEVYDQVQGVYRYYDNGIYCLYRRYDDQGRLLIEDEWSPQRFRVRRDDFNPNGTLRRRTYMDSHYNRPRQQITYRRDGTPWINKMFVVNPDTLETSVERVTMFDREGKVEQIWTTDAPLWEQQLAALVGNDRVFLTVESRYLDSPTLNFNHPAVSKVYAVHSTHLLAPYTDPTKVRPLCATLLQRQAEADAVVFLTNGQRADAEEVTGQQSSFRVIGHPGPAVAVAPAEMRDPNQVVILSRLVDHKRITAAIDAFAIARAKVPAAKLAIYGTGPDVGTLRRHIRKLGVQDCVTLAGYTDQPDHVYRTAALSLLTSRAEGFGLAILESMRQGCPVVSFDLKYGPADMIVEGVNGFVVPVNGKQAMARRIVEILTDESLRTRLWAHTAATVADYTEAAYVARWSRLFNDLEDARAAAGSAG